MKSTKKTKMQKVFMYAWTTIGFVAIILMSGEAPEGEPVDSSLPCNLAGVGLFVANFFLGLLGHNRGWFGPFSPFDDLEDRC